MMVWKMIFPFNWVILGSMLIFWGESVIGWNMAMENLPILITFTRQTRIFIRFIFHPAQVGGLILALHAVWGSQNQKGPLERRWKKKQRSGVGSLEQIMGVVGFCDESIE